MSEGNYCYINPTFALAPFTIHRPAEMLFQASLEGNIHFSWNPCMTITPIRPGNWDLSNFFNQTFQDVMFLSDA